MPPELTLESAADLLARTPATLRTLLAGLDGRWLDANEGPGTYSTRDVVGHLIHGEDTDWIPRLEHILAHGDARPFAPFDREGMRGKHDAASLEELLALFERRRRESLARLAELRLRPEDGRRPGLHPSLGPVTLSQLIATWVVHDLAHLSQIARVLAKARADEIGPWRAFFRTLDDRKPD
jgi:hypothetical protein